MDKTKLLGQVMTPQNIVEHMIDLLALTEEQKNECLFVDNSCGDGAFVKTLLWKGVPANHIYACDIDEEISKPVFELLPQNNFRIGSAFEQEDWFRKFDFVIGNPPYVRIHNIEPKLKNFLKSRYNFCYGMFDLYLAFYELGLKMLNKNGSLLYISPNSFTKTQSGSRMRRYIEENDLLQYYEDFEHEKRFSDYDTYTCIVKLGRGNNIEIPWKDERKKVGLSYATLQNGIATLADRIFIRDDFSFVEQELVHPILKASTGELKQVIAPPATEQELAAYPKAYQYFLENKETLSARNLQGPTPWFAFGRSQGLLNMNKEKIAISTVMSEESLRITRLPADTYVYSGLYATGVNLDKLEQELRSQDLTEYLVKRGKPMSGNYYQITVTLLKGY